VTFLAAPQASLPGLISSIAAVITAATVLLGAVAGFIKVVRPIRETQKRTEAKLDIVHTLVDGTLSTALRSELAATKRELLLLREIQRRDKEDGRDASDDQAAILGATQRKIDELTLAMHDRDLQIRSADIQIETENYRTRNDR